MPTTGLLGPAEVRRIAAEIGLRPSKSRGQNFVVDANTVRRIVRASVVGPRDVVLEVGPRLGSLTLALLPVIHRVVAVEIDPMLATVLPQTITARAPAHSKRLTTLQADALTLNIVPKTQPTALVANLPYNM